jgi:hypothetical protein
MDEERFQQMEKRLNKQAEATRAMNETLNKFLAVMANQEVARNVAPPPPASPPPVTTPLKAWALSYFKGRRAVTFAKRVIQQEIRNGKMCFTSWDEFREEFKAAFCPENEATTTLIRLELDRYFQGKRNREAYIDEFKDLIDLSGYMDPIAIVLEFRHGLNPTTQDRIAESGTDRL